MRWEKRNLLIKIAYKLRINCSHESHGVESLTVFDWGSSGCNQGRIVGYIPRGGRGQGVMIVWKAQGWGNRKSDWKRFDLGHQMCWGEGNFSLCSVWVGGKEVAPSSVARSASAAHMTERCPQ